MAISMDALLRIKAAVEGTATVQALSKGLGGVQAAAKNASTGFRGLIGASSGLVGGLQSLLPLATGAGLMSLASKSIDAASNMHDLSQKAGMSVENLSKFNKAAKVSGTTVEAVANASVKLSKGLMTGTANKALEQLGIKATDATGKLRPTAEVMLDVADKFKAMPDGAEKSALAVQLFGRAGAEMVPMLNMGGDAIRNLSGMSSEYAKQANEMKDKMIQLQGKVGALGAKIAQALLPFMASATDAVVGLVDGFNKLPGPIQTIIGAAALIVIAWGPVVGVIASTITVFQGLAALQLGATIAGWMAAMGPAVVAIQGALTGLLAWLTGTLLPGLLAFFSGPVGWTVLAVAAVVAMCIYFREPLGKFFTWLGEWAKSVLKAMGDLWNSAIAAAGKFFTDVVQALDRNLAKPFMAAWSNIFNGLSKVFSTVVSNFVKYLVQPIQTAWNNLTTGLGKVFERSMNVVRAAFRGILQVMANNINTITGLINRLIGAFNRLPGPNLPFIPMVQVPRFAKGGVVDRATLAMVGEGGEREYIIPESKMGAASARYLSGARGSSVLGGGISIGSPTINVTTGPIMQQDGQQWVTMRDMEQAMRATADGVLARLKTPATRAALGLR